MILTILQIVKKNVIQQNATCLFNELKISQNFMEISEILERHLKDIKLPKIFIEELNTK